VSFFTVRIAVIEQAGIYIWLRRDGFIFTKPQPLPGAIAIRFVSAAATVQKGPCSERKQKPMQRLSFGSKNF
jgi:hypothetical protein